MSKVLPELVGRDTFDDLVIRNDFSDDEFWTAVVGELHRPRGPDGEFPARVQVRTRYDKLAVPYEATVLAATTSG
ncbi:hypothetical protein ACFW9D_14190 [Streptomyces sp. NPDC059524]|uniref:hypothetical protein n=1 Tax=Streptomyces sp. NPDC059524 TaxID=3346856 RepID=UPI003695DD89